MDRLPLPHCHLRSPGSESTKIRSPPGTGLEWPGPTFEVHRMLRFSFHSVGGVVPGNTPDPFRRQPKTRERSPSGSGGEAFGVAGAAGALSAGARGAAG